MRINADVRPRESATVEQAGVVLCVAVDDIALADDVNGLEVIKKLWEGGLREKPRVIVITALGNKAFRGPRAGRPPPPRRGGPSPGGAVGGANAVVTRDVQAQDVVAGVPARSIRSAKRVKSLSVDS